MNIRRVTDALKKFTDYGKRLFFELAVELYALYVVMKDSRVPLRVKLIALIPAAYFISPIDVIMDPIPVLGQLDDLIVFRYSYKVLVKLIPQDVLSECREKARQTLVPREESMYRAWIILVLISILLAVFGIVFLFKKMRRGKLGTSLSVLPMS
jgi:uncharacterized membrane protein YkvA (DUF1232 family)